MLEQNVIKLNSVHMPYIGGNSSLVICLRELVFCESFNVLWRMSLRGIEFLRKLPWRHRIFFFLSFSSDLRKQI